jgi:hypothetical protein
MLTTMTITDAQYQRDTADTPAVIVNGRGMAFSHAITADMQIEAIALADALEGNGEKWGANVVRRLAGLPVQEEVPT